MIRYPVTPAELDQRIEAQKPGWRVRANKRTAEFRRLRRYEEKSSIWGEVKQEYMDLQYHKCAYCERKLPAGPGASVEHHLEHYRPKGAVKPWVPADGRPPPTYVAAGGPAGGYHWLAYDPLNYCTACGRCNVGLKSDYFPVPAGRGTSAMTIPQLNSAEQPFLVYPIGDVDADPETVITFAGVVAKPVTKTGTRRRRADVTIRFFDLNNEFYREERAKLILSMAPALAEREKAGNPADREKAEDDIELRFCTPRNAYSSCAKAFRELYNSEPVVAVDLLVAARQFLLDKVAAP